MIATWSSGDAGYNMDEGLLVHLRSAIAAHPWWRARSRLTISLLRRYGVEPPARVIDVGCGWGTTLSSLEQAGYAPAGMDISRRALEVLDREVPARRLIEADLERDFEAPETFDAALALDVVEHLDDDRSAIVRIARLVVPGGLVILSVPARPDLFSEFDAVQGHRRRYLKPSLRDAFRDTGLRLERLFYWGGWMVPIMKLSRSRPASEAAGDPSEVYARHLRLPPSPFRSVLTGMFLFDHGVSLAGLNPSGTSLFAIARRAR